MSDDSVPLPYPNFKLPQYAFQLQDASLSHLHAAASKAFWEGVEKDEMAPFMQSLPPTLAPPSPSLHADLLKKNEAELEKIEAKIKDAETNMGETDLSEGLREKAGYYCRIGDMVR
jgi:26S proteasome regulatory subunit N7